MLIIRSYAHDHDEHIHIQWDGAQYICVHEEINRSPTFWKRCFDRDPSCLLSTTVIIIMHYLLVLRILGSRVHTTEVHLYAACPMNDVEERPSLVRHVVFFLTATTLAFAATVVRVVVFTVDDDWPLNDDGLDVRRVAAVVVVAPAGAVRVG